ncbi:hypothetical protein ACFL2K_03260 [Candidatus Margulisiibacteriota bacterium]
MKLKKILITGFVAWISYLILGTIVEIISKSLFAPYKEEMAIIFKPVALNPDLKFMAIILFVYLIFALIIVSFYSILRESVPGKSSVQKGFSFGMIVWTLFILMPNVLNYLNYKILSGLFLLIPAIDIITIIPGVVIAAVVYERISDS